MKDSELIELIKKGDERAFEKFFKEHYIGLVAFANKYLHDIDKAESITQEIFVLLWEKKQKYQIQSIKAYLFSAVRNRCNNELKRIQYEQKYRSKINPESQIEYLNYSDSTVLGKINSIIDTLPEQRKKIFKLNRIDGLKYKEIANKLNISPKTVENQMGKALKYLRLNLSELKKQVYQIML
ncbi:RNA polymerase sigma-70 factor [Saccharicrinis aurantiacus]|uniref:RNA polymerase sigma-70 factor n=1 Tax=Saccharicrinis aurantiacus TaxID=1849719 RepID=UPI002491311B|nr:RNA polymerase sigma-70 factor [Saccharicrinis aurantiacus]